MYKFEFTDRQKEALAYLSPSSEQETILYGGSAGGGKTFLGCAWQLQRRLKYPNTRGLIGRAELKRLKQSTMRTFWEMTAKIGMVKDVHYRYNQQDQTIHFTNGSEIILMDLGDFPSDPEFTRLGSIEITDYFVDECAEVSKRCVDIIDSRVRYNLIQDKPKGLLSCNPHKGWLYTEYFNASRNNVLRMDRAFVQALPTDNPHLPPAYLEKLSRLPEVDRKRLLEGDWDYDESNDRLYYYDDLLRCFRSDIIDGGTKYITADIAALGDDKTIIGLWDGMTLLEVHRLEHKYPNEVAQYINNIAKERNVKLGNIVVDADGLGIGVVGILKCQAFNNGARAVNSERYINLKSECYFTLGEYINNNKLSILDYTFKDEIIKHLESVRNASVGTDKRKAVTSKEDIKKKQGFSPDFADMIMMRMYFSLYPNYKRYAVK